jgi:hypothetical protein
MCYVLSANLCYFDTCALQAVALYGEALKLSIKPSQTAAANVFSACYAAEQYAVAVQYIDAALPDLRYEPHFQLLVYCCMLSVCLPSVL